MPDDSRVFPTATPVHLDGGGVIFVSGLRVGAVVLFRKCIVDCWMAVERDAQVNFRMLLADYKSARDDLGENSEKAVQARAQLEGAIAASLPLVAGAIMELALPLVASCLTFGEARDGAPPVNTGRPVDFRELELHHAPALLAAWFQVSFGEEKKVRPWVAAAETVLGRLMGQKLSLWPVVSELYSKLVTDLPTFGTTPSDSLKSS